MLVSATVFLQLSCWSEKYTGIESNERYAKNMKLQSKNVALGAKQGRSLQITILKQEMLQYVTNAPRRSLVRDTPSHYALSFCDVSLNLLQ